MTEATNPLTPKQADREAAAAYYRAHYGQGTKMEARLRDGQHDSQALVQAFAHHAQQARLEERERIARQVEKLMDGSAATRIHAIFLADAIRKGEGA